MAKGSTGRTYIALILASYRIIIDHYCIFCPARKRPTKSNGFRSIIFFHNFHILACFARYQGSLTSWYLDGEQLPDNGSRLTSHHRLSASVPLTGSCCCWCGACGKPWIYLQYITILELFVFFMYSNHNNSPIFRCLNFILRFSDLPLPFMPGHLRDLDGCSWLVLIPLVEYRFSWAWTCLMICDVTCIIWLRVAWAFEWDHERWVSKTMFLRACRAVGSQGFGSFDSFRFVGLSETGSPCFHVWSSVGSSVAKTFLGRFPARESWSWVRSTTIDEFFASSHPISSFEITFLFWSKSSLQKIPSHQNVFQNVLVLHEHRWCRRYGLASAPQFRAGTAIRQGVDQRVEIITTISHSCQADRQGKPRFLHHPFASHPRKQLRLRRFSCRPGVYGEWCASQQLGWWMESTMPGGRGPQTGGPTVT